MKPKLRYLSHIILRTCTTVVDEIHGEKGNDGSEMRVCCKEKCEMSTHVI